MTTTVAITNRGVITLPIKLREELGISGEELLIAETTPEGLLLRPAIVLPLEIYSSDRIGEFDDGERELAESFSRQSE